MQATASDNHRQNNRFKVALIQCCSGIDQRHNLRQIQPQVEKAVAEKAVFVSMPEAVNSMSQGRDLTHYSQCEDPFIRAMQLMAEQHKIWLHLGSVVIKEQGKGYNRTLMINDDGNIVQYYDKMHMFDVNLGSHVICESESYTAGNTITYAQTPWAMIGLSICYDLRFPNMYRQLAQQGCKVLMIPAAFTRITGKAHWHVLLRARAIENGAWVVAAAQCGKHQDGRETYGHSLVIDPWGDIVAEAGETPQLLTAVIDVRKAETARRSIPAWRLLE